MFRAILRWIFLGAIYLFLALVVARALDINLFLAVDFVDNDVGNLQTSPALGQVKVHIQQAASLFEINTGHVLAFIVYVHSLVQMVKYQLPHTSVLFVLDQKSSLEILVLLNVLPDRLFYGGLSLNRNRLAKGKGAAKVTNWNGTPSKPVLLW